MDNIHKEDISRAVGIISFDKDGNQISPARQSDIAEISAGAQDTLSDTGGTDVYFGTVDVQDGSFKSHRIRATITTTTDESAKNIDIKWGFAPSDLGSACTAEIGTVSNTGSLSLPNNDDVYYYTVEFGRHDRYLHIWYDYDALGASNTGTLDISVVKV